MDLGDWEERGDRDQAIGSHRGGMGQVNNRDPGHDIICEARGCFIDFPCHDSSYSCVTNDFLADPSKNNHPTHEDPCFFHSFLYIRIPSVEPLVKPWRNLY